MKESAESLTKLHFVNSLFADLTGHDLYLAQQVKEAIEKSVEDLPPSAQNEAFTKAALELLAEHSKNDGPHCFSHWNCFTDDRRFDPLWARLELINIFKKLAPCPRSTVLITGLRQAICPPGRRWNRALHREYQEAIALIQEIARNWSTSRAEITLLFF